MAGNLFTEVVNGVDTLAVLRCMGFVGSGPVNEVGCTLGWFHRRIVLLLGPGRCCGFEGSYSR